MTLTRLSLDSHLLHKDMSWLKEAAGGGPLPPYVDDSLEGKVPDPRIPNRMVANKPANRPFLACGPNCVQSSPYSSHIPHRYHEYREKQEALHAAWLKKKHERDEKIARGEKVGPLERDPTAQEEVGLLGLLKFIVLLLLFASLAGKFITDSYTWEYESKWMRLKTYWPVRSDRTGFLLVLHPISLEKPTPFFFEFTCGI